MPSSSSWRPTKNASAKDSLRPRLLPKRWKPFKATWAKGAREDGCGKNMPPFLYEVIGCFIFNTPRWDEWSLYHRKEKRFLGPSGIVIRKGLYSRWSIYPLFVILNVCFHSWIWFCWNSWNKRGFGKTIKNTCGINREQVPSKQWCPVVPPIPCSILIMR